jgi:uncharacterized protein (DUF427 family)
MDNRVVAKKILNTLEATMPEIQFGTDQYFEMEDIITEILNNSKQK